jgi:hypothetical protein|uniref:Clostridium neurotoxin receptor binding N-terminal domain-containing protein n=1 Tax=viral metagenome TaxID=1070528 RepID=A0A6C0JBK6_9ZZZZ
MSSQQQFARISDGAGAFSPFKSNKYISGTKDFLQSNSIVAKFAFLLLVLFVFIIVLRLGISAIAWAISPTSDPILINGMVDAKHMIKILQDPSKKGAIPVLRSKNQQDGLVFTWSVWMLIDDLEYKKNEYKHVFHKGNDDINVSKVPIGMNKPNNAPGLYIAPNTNSLIVIMNTFNKINEEVTVDDIPLNKWINVIIRVDEQHQMDIYINGRLVKRHMLSSVPKQNYGDVFVSMNGGFSGYTSSLRYFAEAIGTNKIQSIIDSGPNMKMVGGNLTKSKPRYLSTRWFFSGANDMYN